MQHALQGAANAVQRQQDQLQASKTLLATHKATLNTSCHSFVTSAAHTSLLDSLRLISQLATDMDRLDAQQDYSHKAPGWRPLQLQLQAAASDTQATLAGMPRTGLGTDAQPGSTPHPQQPNGVEASVKGDAQQCTVKGALDQQWHGKVEETIKQLLLWAQGVHSAAHAAEPPVTAGRSMLLHCVTWTLFPFRTVAVEHQLVAFPVCLVISRFATDVLIVK